MACREKKDMPSTRLFDVDSLSLIGLEKNTGKTTFLNYLIRCNQLHRGRTLALTSIGYDGETQDQVTQTAKPRIYVYQGTIIATARSLLARCDVQKEILQASGIKTALGEVILFRALDDGYVELAGPAGVQECLVLKKQLSRLEPRAMFIVDGALSRLSSAGHGLSEACVLCTGASVSANLGKVVEKTVQTVQRLSLKQTMHTATIREAFKTHGLVLFGQNVEAFAMDSILHSGTLFSQVNENCKGIAIKGLLTESLLGDLLNQKRFKDMELVLEDGTRYFGTAQQSNQLLRRGITLKVLQEIDLRLVVINPFSPRDTDFISERFQEKLEQQLSLPILDVRRQHECSQIL